MSSAILAPTASKGIAPELHAFERSDCVRSGRGSLGIYAKNHSPTTKPPHDPRQVRAERYALKYAVNGLLPTSRTSKCHRWTVPHTNPKIHKTQTSEHNKAFYSGLQVCGSVWACPICAAKISERRRIELLEGIKKAEALGLQVMLLTETVPHGLGDDVRVVVDGILNAWSKQNQGRAGQKIKTLIGLRGHIRAFEVTYGKNGFHPHIHALLFLDKGMTPESVQHAFAPLWQQSCRRAGLPVPDLIHGCKVTDGSFAAAYASKWGLESEMTKSHVKKGKQGSKTPWDFLRDVVAKNDDAEKSGALFRLYADTFKGKVQLRWSNGLRDLLQMDEQISDEEIAERIDEEAVVMANLTHQQWDAIIKSKSEALFLDIAEKNPLYLPFALDEITKPKEPVLILRDYARLRAEVAFDLSHMPVDLQDTFRAVNVEYLKAIGYIN